MPARNPVKFSKNDRRYWEARVYHPVYGTKEQATESAAFAIRMQAHGERRNVSLRETTVRDAGKAAMALYRLIKTHGWERGLAEFRGETPPPRNALTLGDYLTEVMAIFAERIRERLAYLVLPDPIPFVGLRTAKERPTRYRSEIENPEILLVAGARELAQATMETEHLAMWREADLEGEVPSPSPAERIRAELRASRKREAFKVLVLGLDPDGAGNPRRHFHRGACYDL